MTNGIAELFASLVFVPVGLLLDPAFLVANAGTVLWIVALVATGEAFIFGRMTRALPLQSHPDLVRQIGQ